MTLASIIAVQQAADAASAATLDDLVTRSVEELAEALANVQTAGRAVKALEKALVRALVVVMPGRSYTVEGVGTLERASGSERKNWDTPLLADAVVRKLTVDSETGEVTDVPEGLVEGLLKAAHVDYWRVTALRDLGIDSDRYCDVVPGQPTVYLRAES